MLDKGIIAIMKSRQVAHFNAMGDYANAHEARRLCPTTWPICSRRACRTRDGHVFTGEWNTSKKEWCGTLWFADDEEVYMGEWKAGEKEGHGVVRWADGDVESCFYSQGAPVGEGAEWKAGARGRGVGWGARMGCGCEV